MVKKKIGVFVGSLRKGSYSRKAANYVCGFLNGQYDVEFVEIGALPYYNEDLDQPGNVCPDFMAFREKVKGLDAFLFATPEYNRSLAPALKNALDIASRGENLWDGKPGAIIAQSIGHIGGAVGASALRVPLAFLNVRLMMQPEVYLSGAAGLFDEQGNLVNDGTAKFLQKFAAAFAAWIEA
ncbi:MAG: NAD(P)H-dependent oxidoreductase [Mediterranea sp.]|jgi:chromate reductase|nr:NAD(P)H-dependent oxidoreductase [Mediterranea sp.]